MTTDTQIVLDKLDRMFAPDIRVRIDDQGFVTGFAPVNQVGAQFLLKRANELLGATYDQALHISAGLTLEVHDGNN